MAKRYRFETLQVHAGHRAELGTGSIATPIYQTTAYQFPSTNYAGNLFDLKEFGNIYSRINNPTNDIFEKRIAALEGGVAALAVSSGHAAQFLVINTLCCQGDNFVSSPYLYGGSYNQFTVSFANWGITAKIAANDKADEIEKLIDARTKLIYVENIGNPEFNVPDFQALSALSAKYGIPLVVDNTFAAGGYLCRPLEHGAHIVIESATKWIGGHGNSMGGVIIDGGTFDWGNGKFPMFTEPSPGYHGLKFWETFGPVAFMVKTRVEGLRDMGPCISPFNAFELIQGLETLSVRMDRICQTAQELALWLHSHPKVYAVNYLGLPDHKYHRLGQKYLQHGFGAVMSFRVKGGLDGTRKFIEGLELIYHAANVGDVRSIMTHPASTTHRQLSAESQLQAGVYPDLVRFSVGLEHIDDLKEDLDQALSNI